MHEPPELVSPEAQEVHRAIRSLIEELDAVDWYGQRAEATSDDELRGILLHHRNEEIEHAMMLLEWLRRRVPILEEQIRLRIGREGPIVFEKTEGPAGPGPGLGIGSLREGR